MIKVLNNSLTDSYLEFKKKILDDPEPLKMF